MLPMPNTPISLYGPALGAIDMEWGDMLVPAIAASTIASSTLSSLMLWHSRRESKRLADVASATLIMELRKPWEKKEFKEFLNASRNNSSFKGSDDDIDSFLNRMETIAMFLESKTLNEVHVKELFAEHFKLILKNQAITEYYNNMRENNKKYTFTNIAIVLEKMKGWDV